MFLRTKYDSSEKHQNYDSSEKYPTSIEIWTDKLGTCRTRTECSDHDNCIHMNPYTYCRKDKGYCYKPICTDHEDCNPLAECNYSKYGSHCSDVIEIGTLLKLIKYTRP